MTVAAPAFSVPHGDPDAIERAAGALRRVATDVERAGDVVGHVPGSLRATWQGSSATAAFAGLASVAKTSYATSASLGDAAEALRTWASDLHEAQNAVLAAQRRADTEHAAYLQQRTALHDTDAPAARPPDPVVQLRAERSLDADAEAAMGSASRAATAAAHQLDARARACRSSLDATEDRIRALTVKAGHDSGPSPVEGLLALVKVGKKAFSVFTTTKTYVSWWGALTGAVREIPNVGFETEEHAAAWARFIISNQRATKLMQQLVQGSGELAPWMQRMLGAVRVGESGLARAAALKGVVGKLALPLTVVTGVYDLWTGGGDKGAHGVATRIAGGTGALGAGTLLLAGSALGPVGLAVAGAAVVGYGLYSLGNMIYKNREAIGHAISSGYHAVASGVQAAVDTERKVVEGAVHVGEQAVHAVADGAKSVVSTLSHPANVLKAIHVF